MKISLPRGRVSYSFLHSFYSVSLSSPKFLRSASTLWARRHGRL